MEVIRTIKPGEKGSQRFSKEYGDRLIAVRYRKTDDEQLLTTIELVVDKKPPPEKSVNDQNVDVHHNCRNQQRVALKIDYKETELRAKVKAAGGWWDSKNRVWRLKYEQVVALDLIERVLSPVD